MCTYSVSLWLSGLRSHERKEKNTMFEKKMNKLM